jgi:hypothetical protein
MTEQQPGSRASITAELSLLMLDYLPGPGPGYPLIPISFQGIAQSMELHQYWRGPSKRHALTALLQGILSNAPEKMPDFIMRVLLASKEMRTPNNPLTKTEIERMQAYLDSLCVSVPELQSPQLLAGLPQDSLASKSTQSLSRPTSGLLSHMREELAALSTAEDENQGYALELFLNKLFTNSLLRPREPFRQENDRIVGVVHVAEFGSFLLHALWQAEALPADIEHLLAAMSAHGKGTKGLLFSLYGFSEDSQELLGRGQTPDLLAIDVRDLFLVLDGGIHLEKMIRLKLESARKQGRSLVLVQDLLAHQ